MLGIVMLNYNGWQLSVDCIESIENTTKIEHRIYLVDNASTVIPSEEIEQRINNFQNVIFIRNNNNRGYAAGNNIGILKAMKDGCNEILITNNDVVFSKDCIDGLQDFLIKNSDVGIVGPKVYLPDGRLQEINMGCEMSLKGKYLYLLRKTPFKSLGRSFLRDFHAEKMDLNKPFQVFGVSGCCFMISKECVQYLYPLDENTFLYEEENIIANKINKLGKKVIYYSPLTIVHLGGQSTKNLSAFSYSCFVESEIYYTRKYLLAKRWEILSLYLIRNLVYMKKYGICGYKEFIIKTWKMFCKNLD